MSISDYLFCEIVPVRLLPTCVRCATEGAICAVEVAVPHSPDQPLASRDHLQAVPVNVRDVVGSYTLIEYTSETC